MTLPFVTTIKEMKEVKQIKMNTRVGSVIKAEAGEMKENTKDVIIRMASK